MDVYPFDYVARPYEVLAASMPLLDDNLAYYPMPRRALPLYHRERALYDDSRINVVLREDILPDVNSCHWRRPFAARHRPSGRSSLSRQRRDVSA